jgi:DNA-binding NarL/FixJ family response regulator
MVLAADASKGSRDQAKSAGANGWMVKPVPFDGLMQVVRQLLASDCLLQERTA